MTEDDHFFNADHTDACGGLTVGWRCCSCGEHDPDRLVWMIRVIPDTPVVEHIKCDTCGFWHQVES